ncbi:CMRF35-like molecule 7 [Galemys pyrenaicus]|uniref:CMRF35-like molecule 7 n=1 Tax=Galemys pyrenaicus TaxID=202257 RepID=A0A8J6A375_GALPY|nr:CMRF35-like molecule 7 [Galemys pyrenaicus]
MFKSSSSADGANRRQEAAGLCAVGVTEQEVKHDHVSIRDHPKYHTFTVTLEELRLDVADTYWCGIERNGTDLGDQVKVTVDPAVTRMCCPQCFAWAVAGDRAAARVKPTSEHSLLQGRTPGRAGKRALESAHILGLSPRSSLLCCIHFWLPVLLKLPLLLCLLGAILWVRRPQRGPPDMEPATPCPSVCPQK